MKKRIKRIIVVSNSFEHALEMLRYFQEEFMFRQQHYWNLIIKSFLLITVVSILPITSEVLGIAMDEVPLEIQRCFPLLGLIITILSFFILREEARRIKAVNEAKYRINRQLMAPKYHYNFYNDTIGRAHSNSLENMNGNKKRFKWLAYKMLYIVAFTELLIIVGVLYIL